MGFPARARHLWKIAHEAHTASWLLGGAAPVLTGGFLWFYYHAPAFLVILGMGLAFGVVCFGLAGWYSFQAKRHKPPASSRLEHVRRLLREAAEQSRSLQLPKTPTFKEAGHYAWFIQKTVPDFLAELLRIPPIDEYRRFLESCHDQEPGSDAHAASEYLRALADRLREPEIRGDGTLPQTFGEFMDAQR